MREAVIVSAARTPIGKAYRGAFNNLESPSMASVAVKAAVDRSGIDPKEVDDCITVSYTHLTLPTKQDV